MIDPNYVKAQQARQRILKQMVAGNNPLQDAFDAFQIAGSLDAMRQAVEQHSLLADANTQKIFKQAIIEQLPGDQRGILMQHLEWLYQVTQPKK